VTGGPWEGISGSLGGEDTLDAFQFFWSIVNGTPEDYEAGFMATAAYDPGAQNPQYDYSQSLAPYLWLYGDGALDQALGSSVIGILGIPNMKPGNYILKVATTLMNDPPFTFTLTGPAQGREPGPACRWPPSPGVLSLPAAT
jgi:hypothetical protein